jgi:hypothetical protein
VRWIRPQNVITFDAGEKCTRRRSCDENEFRRNFFKRLSFETICAHRAALRHIHCKLLKCRRISCPIGRGSMGPCAGCSFAGRGMLPSDAKCESRPVRVPDGITTFYGNVVPENEKPADIAGLHQHCCLGSSWSGRRDSNPRPRPWQGRALPLSYTRIREIGGDLSPATGRAMPNAALECNSPHSDRIGPVNPP